MTSLMGVHWIPTHRGNLGSTPDRDVFARWNPGMVKIVCVDERPPYLEDIPPAALIVIRNHPMSEDGNRGQGDAAPAGHGALHPASISLDAPPGQRPPLLFPPAPDTGRTYRPFNETTNEPPYAKGQRHAALCDTMARYCESKGVSRARLIFEGLNEMQLWAGEPPAWAAQYSLGFIRGLHSFNLHGAHALLGVGWPGNGGITDAPPDWSWFQPVINEFRNGDYLGLHEYWALNGPGQNWRWWAGRFLQCPFRVPILITECGIDTGVTGQWYGGWRDLPGGSEDEKARRYADELVWYAQQCAADGRVKQMFPFTYDIGSSHWEKFDIRNEPFIRQFFARQAEWPQVSLTATQPPPVVNPPPVVTPPPVETYVITGQILNVAPNLGLSYVHGYARQPDGVGWSNKTVKFYWRGNVDAAGSVKTDAAGKFSVEFPDRPTGSYDFELVDPVRGIKSQRVAVDVDRQQVELLFQLMPALTAPPPPVVIGQPSNALHDRAWALAGQHLSIPYNPEAAHLRYARQEHLGAPMTPEFEVEGWSGQGWANGISICVIGQWGAMATLLW